MQLLKQFTRHEDKGLLGTLGLMITLLIFIVILLLDSFFTTVLVEPSFVYHPNDMYVHDYCKGDDTLTIQVSGKTDDLDSYSVVIASLSGEGVTYEFPNRMSLNDGDGEPVKFDFSFVRPLPIDVIDGFVIGETYDYVHGSVTQSKDIHNELHEFMVGPVTLPFTVKDCKEDS